MPRMTETHVDPVLIYMVGEYLLTIGKKTMLECLRLNNDEYCDLTEATD